MVTPNVIEAGGRPDGRYDFRPCFDAIDLTMDEEDAEAVRRALRAEDLPFRDKDFADQAPSFFPNLLIQLSSTAVRASSSTLGGIGEVCTNCGTEYNDSIEECPACGASTLFSEYGGFDWSLAGPAVATYILDGVEKKNSRFSRSVYKGAVKEFLAAEGRQMGEKKGWPVAIEVLQAHTLILRLVMVIRLLRTLEKQSPCNDEALENAVAGASNMLSQAAHSFGEIAGAIYDQHVVEVTDACLEIFADSEKEVLANPLNEMLGIAVLYSTISILDSLRLVCRGRQVGEPLAYPRTLGDVALDYYARLAGHVTGVALFNKDIWKQALSERNDVGTG